MPRRGLLLLVVALAWASVLIDAQTTARGRLGSKASTPAQAAGPSLAVMLPTTTGAFTTSSARIGLSVSCIGVSAPCASVAVTADTGYSGAATGADPTFTIVSSAGGSTLMQDTFTGDGNNVDLILHPSNTGNTWAECIDTEATTNYVYLYNGGGIVFPLGAATSHVLGYCSNAVLPASAWTFSLKIDTFQHPSVDRVGLLFGGSDSTHYCALEVWGDSPDMRFVRKNGGSPVTLGTAVNSNTLNGDTIAVRRTAGGNYEALKNGVTQATIAVGSCEFGTTAGILWGAFGPDGGRVNQVKVDDALIVNDGAASGVALTVGTNDLTIVGADTLGNATTIHYLVTRSATDTVVPGITITSPSGSGSYSTSLSSVDLSGAFSDDIGVTSLTGACATCTPTSFSLTPNATLPQVAGTWTKTAVGLSSGANTIVVTAQDAAGNPKTAQIIVTRLTDMSPPVMSVVTPSANPYAAPSSSLTFAGTCTDDVACTSVTFVCTAASPPSGTTSLGPSNWSQTFTISGNGACVFTGHDAASNTTATASRAFTFAAPLGITSGPTLTNAQSAVPGYSYQLACVSGFSNHVCTWDNQSSGTGLAAADADCAGLTVSVGGLISGTASAMAGAVCSALVRAADGSGSTVNATLTINVVAPNTGPHAYYETLAADSNWYTGYSCRPDPAQNSVTHRNFKDQLHRPSGWSSDYFQASPAVLYDKYIKYDYAGDTDPHKQDACKITIPRWLDTLWSTADNARKTLAVALPAVPVGGCEPIVFSATGGGQYYNPFMYRLDDEVLTQCDPDGAGPILQYNTSTNTAYAIRAALGTSAAAHAVGTAAQLSTNSLQTTATFPIHTFDGNTYLFTWDGYWTDSFMGSGLTNHKAFNFRSAGIWLEPQTNFVPSSVTGNPGCFNSAQHFAGAGLRTYNHINTTPLWPDTDGTQAGPGVIVSNSQVGGVDDQLAPREAQFCLTPNRWIRWWVLVEQVAEDYDRVWMWMADEVTNPVLMTNGLKLSTGLMVGSPLFTQTTPKTIRGIESFYLEYNTSTDTLVGGTGPFKVWYAYFRNLAVLKSPGTRESGAFSTANIGNYIGAAFKPVQ